MKRISKSSFFIKSLSIFSIFIGLFIRIFMFSINKLLRINKKKVVFISFGGKSYSDNPKAISEKLHEVNPEFQIVWLFNNPLEKKDVVPEHVICVKKASLRALIELATSKYWVDNFSKPLYMYKSKKQYYIQTWHGDRGFKKILYDSPFISADYKIFESEKCDLMVSGSDYGDKKYKSAFNYEGPILKQGSPRNDLLIQNSISKQGLIKQKLNINSNTKILLYAPTLRRYATKENELQSSNDIDLKSILNTLEEKTNNEWLCIVRAHSAVRGLEGVPNDSETIIDGSSYEDMMDLLLISDCLITDYSSSAGDFALLNRPIILYQPDRLEYIKEDRSFYFDIDSSPYMIAQSNQEIITKIRNMKEDLILDNCKRILEFYGTIETGEASERVVEYLLVN